MAPMLPSPRLAPYLVVRDAAGLLAFLERALDAKVVLRRDRPDGTVAHSEVRVAGGYVMAASPGDGKEFPGMVHVFVRDVDETYRRVLEAGAQGLQAPEDNPRRNRMAGAKDPFGNQWWFTQPGGARTRPRPAKRAKAAARR